MEAELASTSSVSVVLNHPNTDSLTIKLSLLLHNCSFVMNHSANIFGDRELLEGFCSTGEGQWNNRFLFGIHQAGQRLTWDAQGTGSTAEECLGRECQVEGRG